jgi:hypothetical protein
MSEMSQIVLGILLLAGVFILTQYLAAWRIKQACRFITQDLERLKAFGPDSAVALPYAKTSLLHMGLRDFRPKALGSLIEHSIVGRTENQKYYLIMRPLDL